MFKLSKNRSTGTLSTGLTNYTFPPKSCIFFQMTVAAAFAISRIYSTATCSFPLDVTSCYTALPSVPEFCSHKKFLFYSYASRRNCMYPTYIFFTYILPFRASPDMNVIQTLHPCQSGNTYEALLDVLWHLKDRFSPDSRTSLQRPWHLFVLRAQPIFSYFISQYILQNETRSNFFRSTHNRVALKQDKDIPPSTVTHDPVSAVHSSFASRHITLAARGTDAM